MSTFATIPTRGYTKSDPSWWNILQVCGLALEKLLGISSGSIADTTFTFANNQATTNVTGLLFSSASGKSAWVWIAYKRRTDSSQRYGSVELWLRYNDDTASWVLVDDPIEHGDPSGITFSVTAAGQVQYSTDNQAGANYNGASHFTALTLGT